MRYRLTWLAFAAAISWAVAGNAAGQTQPVPANVSAPMDVGAAADNLAAGSDYLIGPYDLLEISVFQVEELSRTVRVNARGSFSLPLIGQIQAAGLSARDVEVAIAVRLGECCLQDPQVSIFIKEFVSQRVTVEGEVAKPGVYPLTGRTSLLQAIAMASGVGALASENDIVIFRSRTDGTKEQLVFDLEAIREGGIPDPYIQGNDVVVVGKSSSKSVVKNLTDTLRGFIGFGTVR